MRVETDDGAAHAGSIPALVSSPEAEFGDLPSDLVHIPTQERGELLNRGAKAQTTLQIADVKF